MYITQVFQFEPVVYIEVYKLLICCNNITVYVVYGWTEKMQAENVNGNRDGQVILSNAVAQGLLDCLE